MVDYVIPGNDDAIRAVKLITGVMANAIVEANGGKLVDYVSDDKTTNPNEIMQKAVDSVKKKEPRRTEENNRGKFNKGSKKTFEKKSFAKESNKEKVEAKKEEKPAKKEEKAAVKEDLTKKTVAELREMAKTKDIKGYSTMKKQELVDALK